MKRGFTLVEIIISISLISVISALAMIIIKRAELTYADPYENIRVIISDASNIFLSTNVGVNYKEELYEKGEIVINTNQLIDEGLIEESYFVENINEEKNISNIEIVVSLDDEGFLNYSINIV